MGIEVDGFRLLFYGHGLFPFGLFADLVMGLWPLALLYIYINIQKRNHKVLKAVFGYVWVMFFPNSLYLFSEFRHLLVEDGIADNPDALAVLGFGTLALTGLVLTLTQIYVAVTRVTYLSRFKYLSAVVLSFLAGWGCALGMLNVSSLLGTVFPPIIIYVSLRHITRELLLLIFVLGTGLSVLSLTTLIVKPGRFLLRIFEETY